MKIILSLSKLFLLFSTWY